MTSELLEPGVWRRDGRGLAAEFKDLSATRLKAALDCLPEGCEQFAVIAVEKHLALGGYVDEIHLVDPLELDERATAGMWNYFLWSRTLTPGLDPWMSTGPAVDLVGPVLAVNGLINLQYRQRLKGVEQPTRVGCVSKVVSTRGDSVRHQRYETAYRKLVRRLGRPDMARSDG